MTPSSLPETPARCGLIKPKAGEGILAHEADTPLDRTRALQRLREDDRAYVMESQKAVLARFGGPDVPAAVSAAGAGAPKIELF